MEADLPLSIFADKTDQIRVYIQMRNTNIFPNADMMLMMKYLCREWKTIFQAPNVCLGNSSFVILSLRCDVIPLWIGDPSVEPSCRKASVRSSGGWRRHPPNRAPILPPNPLWEWIGNDADADDERVAAEVRLLRLLLSLITGVARGEEMSEATAPSPGPLPQCHGHSQVKHFPKKKKKHFCLDYLKKKNQSTDFKLCNFAHG